MLESMFDADGVPTTTAIIGAAVVLVVIVLVIWAIRRRGPITFLRGGHGRQPRLAVLDATPVDSRRRLVLVRRDHIEHLILIGGPTDVVIESRIIKSDAARFAQAASAGKTAAATGDRMAPPPLPEPVPMPPPVSKPTESSGNQTTGIAENTKPTPATVQKREPAAAGSNVQQQVREVSKPAPAPSVSIDPAVRAPVVPSRGQPAAASKPVEPAAGAGFRPERPATSTGSVAEPKSPAAGAAAAMVSVEVKPDTPETTKESGATVAMDGGKPEDTAREMEPAEPLATVAETPEPVVRPTEVTPMKAPAVEPPGPAENAEEPTPLSKAQELIGEFDQLLESELYKDEPKATDEELPSPEMEIAGSGAANMRNPTQDEARSQPAKQASLEDEMKKLLGDLSTRR